MTSRAVLSAGSNLGDSRARLAEVVDALGDRVIAVSGVYVTAPWGGVEQDDFVNQTIIAEAPWTPREWLQFCRECERAADRVRRIDEDQPDGGSEGIHARQLIDRDLHAGLFFRLADGGLRRCLAPLGSAAGNGPHAEILALDQQHVARGAAHHGIRPNRQLHSLDLLPLSSITPV